jgi:hypothetical protein
MHKFELHQTVFLKPTSWNDRRSYPHWSDSETGSTDEVVAMPNAMKTRSELESLVLAELHGTRFCAEARPVTVISPDDEGFDAIGR